MRTSVPPPGGEASAPRRATGLPARAYRRRNASASRAAAATSSKSHPPASVASAGGGGRGGGGRGGRAGGGVAAPEAEPPPFSDCSLARARSHDRASSWPAASAWSPASRPSPSVARSAAEAPPPEPPPPRAAAASSSRRSTFGVRGGHKAIVDVLACRHTAPRSSLRHPAITTPPPPGGQTRPQPPLPLFPRCLLLHLGRRSSGCGECQRCDAARIRRLNQHRSRGWEHGPHALHSLPPRGYTGYEYFGSSGMQRSAAERSGIRVRPSLRWKLERVFRF